MSTPKKLAVHFGAGSIGRAFIGALLHANDYHIVFVDTDAALVTRLNATPRYAISILATPSRQVEVTNYSAVLAHDTPQLLPLLQAAEIITTAIGAANLKFIVPTLQAFIDAKDASPTQRATFQNIICAENGVRVTSQLQAMLRVPPSLRDTLGFVDAAVDRIVPTAASAVLDVAAEDFYEFALSAPQWRGTNTLRGADYYTDIAPVIERKVLMLNGTHAYIAWLGFGHYTHIHEFAADSVVSRIINDYVSNLATLLSHKYASTFKAADMRVYGYRLIERFSNPLLADPITRVGRNVKTKLGPQERIVSPLLYAWQHGLAYAAYIRALLAALAMKDYDDPEYRAVRAMLAQDGLEAVLQTVCGITDGALIAAIKEQAARLNVRFTD